MAQIFGIFWFYFLYLAFIHVFHSDGTASSTQVITTLQTEKLPPGVTSATIEDYPFVLTIMVGSKFRSMATLVASKWAVTRAAILDNLKRTGDEYSAVVVAGATYPTELNFCPYNRKSAIEEIIVHEKYDAEKKIHDIGLVKLVEALELSIAVRPVDYATRHDTHDRDLAEIYDECAFLYFYQDTVTIQNKTLLLYALQKFRMTPIPRADCKIRLEGITTLTTNRDFTCMGPDPRLKNKLVWGGPLVCEANGHLLMQGVRADVFRKPTEGEIPIVFTRIDKHCDWLRYKISSNAMSAFKRITVAIPVVMIVSALMR